MPLVRSAAAGVLTANFIEYPIADSSGSAIFVFGWVLFYFWRVI